MEQKKINNKLIYLLVQLNQKKGYKYKVYKKFISILNKISLKLKLNIIYILEIAVKNLTLSFFNKKIYINNVSYKIPIFISKLKSIKNSVKLLNLNNNLYKNIIDSFNNTGDIIKHKLLKIKQAYKNKIYLNYLNIMKKNIKNKSYFYYKNKLMLLYEIFNINFKNVKRKDNKILLNYIK